MGCDSFGFMVTFLNELKDQAINRRNHLVESVLGHSADILQVFRCRIPMSERCFCRRFRNVHARGGSSSL